MIEAGQVWRRGEQIIKLIRVSVSRGYVIGEYMEEKPEGSFSCVYVGLGRLGEEWVREEQGEAGQ